MKRLLTGMIILGFAMVMFSCAEMENLNLSSISKHVPTGTVMGGDGFKSDEVLCAYRENQGLKDNTYYVAKVVTPATPQTKNQAEVIFVADGKKMWTQYVIPSHKADKSEIKLGTMVFRHVWANSDDISADSYRKQYWRLQRVSSTDEIFKGVVEVEGKKSHIKWLRIPDQVIE